MNPDRMKWLLKELSNIADALNKMKSYDAAMIVFEAVTILEAMNERTPS